MPASAPAPAFSPLYGSAKVPSPPCREWNQAYAQLEMERGFCSLGGAEKYSPELVQRRAFESPAAAARVVLRGAEMLWRLGVFAFSLLADNAGGHSEEVDRVRLRAQQLRCAPSWVAFYCCPSSLQMMCKS